MWRLFPETTMVAAAVPGSLKDVGVYIQRAEEVGQVDPVIAYWCKYYAAQLGVSKPTNDAEAKAFLLRLMDDLESRKQALKDNDAVNNDTVGNAYVENFAHNVFLAADNEDREGNASRNTVRAFMAAAKYLELLTVFGPLEPDVLTKIRYAKWKAAQISKAVREGWKPSPGPCATEDEEVLSRLVTPMHVGGEDASQRKDDDASAKSPSDKSDDASETMMPDVPAHTASETQKPKAHMFVPDAHTSLLTPSVPPAQTRDTESGLSIADIAKVQKLSRWASSALDYDDVATARTHLQEALHLLGPAP